MTLLGKRLLSGFVGAVVMCCATHAGALSCDTTQVITGNYTMNADWDTTTTQPCFKVQGATTVFNMAGHTITCNRAAGCSAAVQMDNTGTVRNGNIVSGTGAWNEGVFGFNFGTGLYTRCTVENMLISDATSVSVIGATEVENTVMLGSPTCIDTGSFLYGGGTRFFENYCSATTTGFDIAGPSSGTHTVERNLIRLSDASSTGILVTTGNVDITHNVIEASTPIDDSGATSSTLSENICSDAADCPDPTARGFTFNLNFN